MPRYFNGMKVVKQADGADPSIVNQREKLQFWLTENLYLNS